LSKALLSRRDAALALASLAASPFAHANAFAIKLVEAAREQTQQRITYDGAYRRIGYPMGDVPGHVGVCTDVLIRAYRRFGIDLQVLVHEDMAKHFQLYPRHWGMKGPDRNIDHRRVPNLQVFFTRFGGLRPVSDQAQAYVAGELVTWRLPGNLPHIGIVSDRLVPGTSRPKMIHNIGAGPVEDDILFAYPITGHYRYGW
jgi:uncharacterized protein